MIKSRLMKNPFKVTYRNQFRSDENFFLLDLEFDGWSSPFFSFRFVSIVCSTLVEERKIQVYHLLRKLDKVNEISPTLLNPPQGKSSQKYLMLFVFYLDFYGF